jgi:hypothetical protein
VKSPLRDLEERDRRVLDVLINIGILTNKRLKKPGLALQFYDPKRELLMVRRVLSKGEIQYEVYIISNEDFSNEVNYEQIPRLMGVTTTKDFIQVDHFLPGVWEERIAEIAEEKLHGETTDKLEVERPSRTEAPKTKE